MSKLLLTFYGDDFTGSTDALEQLTLAGIRTALFIAPPSRAQLRRFPHLQAVGVAGMTRSMAPAAMERELLPALRALKKLAAPHVHYKVCSTFDSSPKIGNIGCVLDIGQKIFRAPFVPLLVAAPGLGRYCAFGNLFARFGIGSNGEIHRLDRHPSISRHPVTPMTEADLRWHLAQQTKKKIALFDILQVELFDQEARTELKRILSEEPAVILFDAIYPEQLQRIGGLIDGYASVKRPLFSIGSSGIETALAAHWGTKVGRGATRFSRVGTAKQILVGSGSCSAVTEKQITWAVKNGFAEVAVDVAAFLSVAGSVKELERTTATLVKLLQKGRSVIVHTTSRGVDKRIASALKPDTGRVLGKALGEILRAALERAKVTRLCIAGGDTSSFAARAMGIEALEMIAPLTPGAPLCRAFAPGSPVDRLEIVFKGGQVGAEDYFGTVKRGRI